MFVMLVLGKCCLVETFDVEFDDGDFSLPYFCYWALLLFLWVVHLVDIGDTLHIFTAMSVMSMQDASYFAIQFLILISVLIFIKWEIDLILEIFIIGEVTLSLYPLNGGDKEESKDYEGDGED